jgi:hypothetical protein
VDERWHQTNMPHRIIWKYLGAKEQSSGLGESSVFGPEEYRFINRIDSLGEDEAQRPFSGSLLHPPGCFG